MRTALVAVAIAAYEDARLQGLCSEGAWEAAIAAMRRLDLTHPPDESRSGSAPGGGLSASDGSAHRK